MYDLLRWRNAFALQPALPQNASEGGKDGQLNRRLHNQVGVWNRRKSAAKSIPGESAVAVGKSSCDVRVLSVL